MATSAAGFVAGGTLPETRRNDLLFSQIGVIDVLTAALSRTRRFVMTSNAEEQTKTEASASARAPEAPTKANAAPRKPRVPSSKPKSGKKARPAKGRANTPRTQKVTSSLSVGSGIDENRVRIDGCRIWFYLYDRCRAPAMLKRLSGSIVLASCCGSSRNVSKPSPSWRESVRSPLGKPIVTSNMRSN
jgi:hypothetical protein